MSVVLYNKNMHLVALGGLKLGDSTFQKPKPLLLLAYLLLEGPTERRHLAELFWPNAENHLNSLSKALSQLRQAVPDALETDEARVWATLASDAGEVLSALEQSDYEQAARLYKAPFLEGVFLNTWGAELEEWVYSRREQLAGRVRAAHLGVAEEAATEGRMGEALRHAEAAFTLNAAPPLEVVELERLHRLFLLGESAYLPLLHTEAESYSVTLGLTKEEAEHYFQTEALDPSPTLSARGTTFVGRELEIAELGEMLQRDNCRLITLVGQGGTGKTRLALEVARQQQEQRRFNDGVYFISLEAVAEPSALPIKVAEVLRLVFQGQDAPAVQIQRHLKAKQSLLIFDNFEHLLAGAVLLSDLLGAGPNVSIIATSRERLQLEEEWLFTLQGLPYPTETVTRLEDAVAFDALQLFVERARRVQRQFELSEDNWHSAAEICMLVEGLPLAIELAASWVKAISLTDIAGELKKNTDVLSTNTRNIPDRHQSIQAAFEHSWALLLPREQESLSKLTVFRGGFTREAADEVAGVSTIVLASLVDKSLLPEPFAGRYDFHPLLHQYALGKRDVRPELAEEVQARHRTFYLRRLQAWRATEVYPSPQTIAALAPDIGNILAAWRRTFMAGGEEVVLTAEALTWYFEVRAQYHEGVAQLAAAAENLAAAEADSETLGYLSVFRAWLAHWLENERAIVLAEEGLRHLRPLGAVDGIILGLRVLGIVLWRRGEYPEAECAYREALELAREAQKQVWEAIILDGLGLSLSCQGDYEEAKHCHAAALRLNQTLNNPFQQVHNLANLATVTRRMGQRENLATLAGQALVLAREIDFKQYVPYCVTELAWAKASLGANAEAETTALEGFELASSIGDNWTQAGSLLLLGHISTEKGEFAEAQHRLGQSFTVAWANQDLSLVLRCLLGAARLAALRGESEMAALWLCQLGAHPATPHWTARDAQTLLTSLQKVLPQPTFARMVEKGQNLSLKDTLVAAFPDVSLVNVGPSFKAHS